MLNEEKKSEKDTDFSGTFMQIHTIKHHTLKEKRKTN